MDLRDAFAIGAAQGMMASPHSVKFSYDDYAERAYAMADAMLKERAK